jgi:hypothetical protein
MMWPRLSKELSDVARSQAVVHSRGYPATCSGEIQPPAQVGRMTPIIPRRIGRSGRAELVLSKGEALAKGSTGGG